MLRREYRTDNHDAHPNERANREIGPQFVSFVDSVVREFFSDTQQPAGTPFESQQPEHSDSDVTPQLPSTDVPVTDNQTPDTGIGNLPCPSISLPLLVLSVAGNIARKKPNILEE